MKVFATLVLMTLVTVSSAQEIREMSLPWKEGQKVVLNLKFADSISVEAWDKKEVFLKAQIVINGGALNHAHVMDSILTNDEVVIEADFDEEIVGKSWCDCNGNSHNGIRYGKKMKNMQQICSEIIYTVYLPKGADLELETISGDIKIVNMKGAIDAESVSGTVDVTIPSDQKADVTLKSVMGRVSSNPDITTLVNGLRPMLARKLDGKLNGGGKSVHLESVTGNVSLTAGN